MSDFIRICGDLWPVEDVPTVAELADELRDPEDDD